MCIVQSNFCWKVTTWIFCERPYLITSFSIHQGLYTGVLYERILHTEYHNTIYIEKINLCIVNSQPHKLIWSLSLFLLSSQFGLITFFFCEIRSKVFHILSNYSAQRFKAFLIPSYVSEEESTILSPLKHMT